MKIEEAIEEAIDAYLLAEMPPDIKQAAFLASLRANGYEIVPNVPTKEIVEAMRECEFGEYSFKEAWTRMLAAAQGDENE